MYTQKVKSNRSTIFEITNTCGVAKSDENYLSRVGRKSVKVAIATLNFISIIYKTTINPISYIYIHKYTLNW